MNWGDRSGSLRSQQIDFRKKRKDYKETTYRENSQSTMFVWDIH